MSHNKEYDQLVPNEIFDIENSDEIAEMWLGMDFGGDKINPCLDCGVEVDNLDSEYCPKCWNKWCKDFEKATGQNPQFITV